MWQGLLGWMSEQVELVIFLFQWLNHEREEWGWKARGDYSALIGQEEAKRENIFHHSYQMPIIGSLGIPSLSPSRVSGPTSLLSLTSLFLSARGPIAFFTCQYHTLARFND